MSCLTAEILRFQGLRAHSPNSWPPPPAPIIDHADITLIKGD